MHQAFQHGVRIVLILLISGALAAPAASAKSAVDIVLIESLGQSKIKDAPGVVTKQLSKLMANRYEVIGPEQMNPRLAKAGVSQAEFVASASAGTGAKKLREIKQVIVVTVWGLPDGPVWVTGRRCERQSGHMVCVAQIAAEDKAELTWRVASLVKQLAVTKSPTASNVKLKLPKLPKGAKKRQMRAQQIESLGTMLEEARDTMSEKNEWVVFLRKNFDRLAEQFGKETLKKARELRALGILLVDESDPDTPRRKKELAKEISALLKPLRRGYLANRYMDKRISIDLGKGVKMTLALIPRGRFVMGSPTSEKGRSKEEAPQRTVVFRRAFYMGVCEVTQKQYKTVYTAAVRSVRREQDPRKRRIFTGPPNCSFFKGDKLPVEDVCWEDAAAFCKMLSKQLGKTIRMPTEAEWEYACRAGTQTPFNTGKTITPKQANYDSSYAYLGAPKGKPIKKTAPVGSYKPNAWGLHDMHGNVSEWCSDWYWQYPDEKKEIDPPGPDEGIYRVHRGGNWLCYPWHCRSACRGQGAGDVRDRLVGFRVVYIPEE